MTVVLDTNVLVQALDGGHPFARILEEWTGGGFSWAVSTDILMEYEEVITRMFGPPVWHQVARMVDLGDAVNSNLVRVATYFQFLAIAGDRDDDEFADCAIAVHADYVISEDKHFRTLAGAGYKPQPITPEEFIRLHLSA